MSTTTGDKAHAWDPVRLLQGLRLNLPGLLHNCNVMSRYSELHLTDALHHAGSSPSKAQQATLAAPGVASSSDADDSSTSNSSLDSCPGLTQVAGVISALAGDVLGGLLSHPGHATVGVYYLAQQHAMEAAADHIDGRHASDADLLQQLVRWVDVSDSIYPDRYPVLVKEQGVVAESSILFWNQDVHKLRPGYYLARDDATRQLLWVLRGTHDLHDLLTDLAGVATQLPGAAGGWGHWGMWQAAAWLLEEPLDRVVSALELLEGYDLLIIGHSMGAGVAALLVQQLTSVPELAARLQGRAVRGMGVATAACMSGELAAGLAPCFTTLVLRHDLVPRFSAASMAGLKEELLALDYRTLVKADLLEHPIYLKATKAAEAAKTSVQRHMATQRAAAAAQAAAAHLAKGAAAAQAVAAKVAGAAQTALSGRQAQAGTPAPAAPAATPPAAGEDAVTKASSSTAKEGPGAAAAQEGAAAAAAPGLPPAAGEVAVGDERHAAEQASAAGQLSDVALYAPGRLLYLRPRDASLPDADQRYDLLEGTPGARFQRIVLAPTCLSDHFPAAYKAALLTVAGDLKAAPPPAAASPDA